ncbi:MAG: YbaK/EbsC family protein [Synergistaceae bacterium]|nr:YbaK/EbsC family protein [Synergistaceae bacterium]
MTKSSGSLIEITGPVERVRAFLREKGYPDEITISEKTIFTVEDASLAVGAPPAHILKSLVFIADERPVLALMSGVNKVNPKRVRDVCGAKKIRMADPDFVLSWSGYQVGGVPPVGYPEAVTALLDEDIFQYPVVWAAAGSEHAFFPVSPEDLLKMTGGSRHPIKK